MTKSLINFILTFIIAYIFSFFMGWYSVMTASLLTALFIPLKRLAVFFVPFLSIFLLWCIYSYVLSSSNDFILAKKIAVLLPLNGNPYLLILITGLIGGLAAGAAALFGNQLRVVFSK